MSWRKVIMNRDRQLYQNNVKIINEFPSSDNFAKSNYRKSWVSVIFVDIVGYTRYCELNSDEDVGKLVRTFHEGVLSIMRHHKLKHIDIQGDGIFGVIDTPEKNCPNSRAIFECAMDINGFLNRTWKMSDYKISLAMSEELMLIVGNDDERKIVFAGGAVNEAKKLNTNCDYTNTIIIDSAFVYNNRKVMTRSDGMFMAEEIDVDHYISEWVFTEWK